MANIFRLKAWVRYDGKGRLVGGGPILQESKPKNGDWVEIPFYEYCCQTGPTTTTSTSTSTTTSTSTSTSTTTSTTTLLPEARQFWLVDYVNAGRSMFIPNQTSFYTGNTIANITATNPDLVYTGVFSQNIFGSFGLNTTRVISENISSPFTTISPDYVFNAQGGFPIMRSLKEEYAYVTKIINNSFLATRNAQVVIVRVSTNITVDSGVLNADGFFMIGVDFDATGQERDGTSTIVRDYDFGTIPGTLNIASFTYSSQFGGFSANSSNIPMNLTSPSTSWVNNVTVLYGNTTIREIFTIPPGW
jgi:hypothetical protein